MSIIANTACLALDKYPPDEELMKKLDAANIGFFCIFLSELIMKVIGMGPRGYVQDQFNIFDAFVGKHFKYLKLFSPDKYCRSNLKLLHERK